MGSGLSATLCGTGVLPKDPALLARDFGQLTPQQTTVLVSLPLPDPLERLMRLFRVMNTVYGFLLRNHIQVSSTKVARVMTSTLSVLHLMQTTPAALNVIMQHVRMQHAVP